MLEDFFSFVSMKCASSYPLITFVWKFMLFDFRMSTPISCLCLLGKPFYSPSLWGNAFLCSWDAFLVSFKMTQNVRSCFAFSLYICVFLLLELSPLMLKHIDDQWLLIPVILISTIVVRVCVCVCVICMYVCMFLFFSFLLVWSCLILVFNDIVTLLVLPFSF